MISGEMQYIADSLLIEKIFLIDGGINKQAGMADGLLGSIAESIMSWGRDHINTQSGVSGILSSLADIMIPGILFKINPLLGGLGTAAQVLGFSPVSIIKKIMQFLQSKLNTGELPTMDEINDVGKSAVSAEAGSIEASADMLDVLHQIEKRGQLVRLVRTADLRGIVRPDIPFFGGQGGVIERIFGQLFKSKAKGKARWLLGGFIVWIIKTILLGAGLIASGEKLTSLLTNKSKDTQAPSDPLESPDQKSEGYNWAQYNRPSKNDSVSNIKLTATGNGQETHVNDHQTSTWVVPMVNGSIDDTLLVWAGDIYKELSGRDSIADAPSFRKTVNELKSGLDSSNSNQLTIPTQFKSRKQIVDQFALEAASKL